MHLYTKPWASQQPEIDPEGSSQDRGLKQVESKKNSLSLHTKTENMFEDATARQRFAIFRSTHHDLERQTSKTSKSSHQSALWKESIRLGSRKNLLRSQANNIELY